MFKGAHEVDPLNLGAIVNLGALEFEHSNYENAAIRFLDALEIKGYDEEALCNLALSLKKTNYIDFAQTAFEEAVNVSPGNTFIIQNYMLFLLEQKNFTQFDKVMLHAKRVMDRNELDTITKLYDEFKQAIDGTEGKVLPEDSQQLGGGGMDLGKMRSVLKKAMKSPTSNQLQVI